MNTKHDVVETTRTYGPFRGRTHATRAVIAVLALALVVLGLGSASMQAAGASVATGQWAGAGGPVAANQMFGYPYPNSPDCSETGSAGCVVDRWNFYQGQCTSWVAYRLNQLNGVAFNNSYGGQHWGDASNWANAAQKEGIAVNGSPGVGSVAYYASGHVAYVEAVNSPTSVVISEMNYDFHNGFRVRTITTASGWPTSFIHIRDTSGQSGSDDASGLAGVADATVGGSMRQDGTMSFNFPVINNGPGTWRPRMVFIAVRGPGGQNLDAACATSLTLSPGQSFTCSTTAAVPYLGSYQAWFAWQRADGSYSDGTDVWTGRWGWTDISIDRGPLDGVVASYVGGSQSVGDAATVNWTVENELDQTVTLPEIASDYTGPDGRAGVIDCDGGTNVTLSPGEQFVCTITLPFDTAGSWTADITYRRPGGDWYSGTPMFTVPWQFDVTQPEIAPQVEVTSTNIVTSGVLGSPLHLEYTALYDPGTSVNAPAKHAWFIITAGDFGASCDGLDLDGYPTSGGVWLQPGQSYTCSVDTTVTRAIGDPGTTSLVSGGVQFDPFGVELFDVLGSFEVAPTTPGAPTGVTAQAGDSSATVSFGAPADNGGAAVTGYTVTASPGGMTATGGTSPITVTGLTNGVAYTFRVAATNSVGRGAASAPSNSVTPAGVPGPPAVPTVVAGNGQATVRWSPPTLKGGTPITHYVVTTYAGSTIVKSVTLGSTARSAVITGLTNGTAYRFAVAAVNAAGNGVPSFLSAATIAGTPGAPTGISMKRGNGSVTIRWDAPSGNGSAITGYVITPYLGATAKPSMTFASTATTETIGGLTNGATYTLRVAATNARGTGATGSSASVTVGVPMAPSGLIATAQTGSASLSWTAPADNGSAITAYVVTPYLAGVAQPAITFASAATTVTVTGLSQGKSYTFTVAARNARGMSLASLLSNAVVPL